jgi:putative hydrolase of the HAD superfamily
MSALPRAVLLDLDDTILDDSSGIVSCWRDACLAHCSTMNGLEAEAVFEAIDRIREWYWSDPERHRAGRLELAWARGEVVRLALAGLGVDDEELARRIGDTYHTLRDDAIKPFDDAVPTVRWLREQGCRLALLTNGGSKGQRLKIDRFDLAGLFDAILIEGEVGFGKPDPRIYSQALAALDVPAADAWMVGDNLEWDVAGPQRQGIIGIWIDARRQGVPDGHAVLPDRIINRLADLRGGSPLAGSRPNERLQ